MPVLYLRPGSVSIQAFGACSLNIDGACRCLYLRPGSVSAQAFGLYPFSEDPDQAWSIVGAEGSLLNPYQAGQALRRATGPLALSETVRPKCFTL